MRENIVKNKSYSFALRIIALYKELSYKQKEYVLSKQLLKAGTSIGANIEEADCAQSQKDFIAKMQISLKETVEVHYWLRLLRDSGFITHEDFEPLMSECNELKSLLTAILKTAKRNLK